MMVASAVVMMVPGPMMAVAMVMVTAPIMMMVLRELHQPGLAGDRARLDRQRGGRGRRAEAEGQTEAQQQFLKCHGRFLSS